MNLSIPFSYFFISFDNVFYLVLFIALCQHFIQYSIINDKYLYRYIKIKFFSFEILKKIIKISYGFNFQIIANIVKGPGFISLLGLTNNISFIGMISTLRTMFYFFPRRLVGILENTFFLEYSKMINKKNKKEFFLYYIKINILILILLIIFLSLSFLLGEYFYTKWTNYNYNFDNELIFLIALDASFYILASFITLPLKSINNYGIIGIFDFLINIIIISILYHNNFFYDLIFSFKIILIGSFSYLILSIYLSNIYIRKINGVSKHIKR